MERNGSFSMRYLFFLSYLVNLISATALYPLLLSTVTYTAQGQMFQIGRETLVLSLMGGVTFMFVAFLPCFYVKNINLVSREEKQRDDSDKKRCQMWSRLLYGIWACGFMALIPLVQWLVFLTQDGRPLTGYDSLRFILFFSILGIMVGMIVAMLVILYVTKHLRE